VLIAASYDSLMPASHPDALVIFGVTGDLAHKMIFPALDAMAKRGTLTGKRQEHVDRYQQQALEPRRFFVADNGANREQHSGRSHPEGP
jgi:glucose-6-phosphate 1-dehydrogenase